MDDKQDNENFFENNTDGMETLLNMFANAIASSVYDKIKDEKELNAIESIKRDFRRMIDHLFKAPKDFKINDFINILKEYLTNNGRLLYSEFTTIIIEYNKNSSNDQKVGNIIINLENCISYAMNEENEIDNIIKKTLIKLWDHANLASNQYNYFIMTDDAFIEKVKPLLEPKTEELKKQYSLLESEVSDAKETLNNSIEEVKNTKYKIVSDIIGLISIFVAISFVMFGGMTLLNNLFDFSNMIYVPVTEMLCLGSLIGLILIAIIYAFMVFILKLLDKSYTDKLALNILLGGIIIILLSVCITTFFIWQNEPNKNIYAEPEMINQIEENTQDIKQGLEVQKDNQEQVNNKKQ